MNSVTFSLAVVLAISCSSQGESEVERVELEVVDKCMKDEDVTESEIEDIFEKNVISESKAMKCFLSCYMKKMEYMSIDGVLDWNKIDASHKVEFTKPEEIAKAQAVTTACRGKVPLTTGNSCETAFSAMKCYFEEAQKRGLPLSKPSSK